VIEDIVIEVARIEREARERVRAKLATLQLGEAWVGISQAREDEHPVRSNPL
jgi:hypothetical protein